MGQQPKRFDGVFEGGGVKGIGLVGALAAIEEAGYEAVNVAGTSAGAIVASLYAAGYTAAELKPIIMGLDFNKFTDPPAIGHLPLIGAVIDELVEKGLYKGDFFLNLMRDLLGRKGVHTFRDLLQTVDGDDERYRFKLRVIASDITRGCMLVLPQDVKDYSMAPEDLEVALAVRMSMSIPFFFIPVRLGGSYVVDGGLLSNFPVELFDSAGEPAWPTFGFKLVRANDLVAPSPHPITGPLSELAAIVFTAMAAQDAYYLRTDKFARTITIDTLDVRMTDFNLSAERKEALYQSGVAAAKDFLAHWDFDRYKALYRSGRPIPRRREQALLP
jgi:NTE family protein